MHQIIIDTDPGVDDAQAIAFAIAHPQIELLGLTTVFGNATVDITTNNALTILEHFGHATIPVATGADKPLVQPRFPAPDFVHGHDGLGNLNLSAPSLQPAQLSAAEFIVQQADTKPGEVTLVAIGPLTNIAQAVMLDASLPSKIKELVIMGGTVDQPGNVTPLAEANFINDPHAADQVLAHDWPCTVIGLDVTLQTLLTDQDLMHIRDHAGSAGQLLWDSSRFYIDFYTSRLHADNSQRRECAMHDASAVVHLVERDAFQLVSGAARVVDSGIATGQLAVDREGEPYLLDHWQGRPPIKAAMAVDAARVKNTFIQTLSQYEFA